MTWSLNFRIVQTSIDTRPLYSLLEGGTSLEMLRVFPSSWSEPIGGSSGLKESIGGR